MKCFYCVLANVFLGHKNPDWGEVVTTYQATPLCAGHAWIAGDTIKTFRIRLINERDNRKS